MAANELVELFNSNVNGNGTWKPASHFNIPASIAISGIVGGDVLKVCVSNDAAQPADATHGVQYGADVTADGKVELTAPFRWVKVRKTAATGGGTNVARLFAQII